MTDSRGLNGEWLGIQDDAHEIFAFGLKVTFAESAGHLTGTLAKADINIGDTKSKPRMADIWCPHQDVEMTSATGVSGGRVVRFGAEYRGKGALRESFTGTLSADGQKIEGDWYDEAKPREIGQFALQRRKQPSSHSTRRELVTIDAGGHAPRGHWPNDPGA